MSLISGIKHHFNIAFRGKVGNKPIAYTLDQHGLTATSVAETLKEFLVVYAAYFELGEKLLKHLPIASVRIDAWGRLITSGIAIFLLGHVLLSWKEGSPKTYTYSRLPRIFAGVTIWIVIFTFGLAIKDLVFQPKTTFDDSYSLSSSIPVNRWQVDAGYIGTQDEKRYVANITVSDFTKEKYKDIEINIHPYPGFELTNVFPKPTGAVRAEQGPIMRGELKPTGSLWLFPNFDEAVNWKLIVVLKKSGSVSTFPQTAPVQASIYVYK